MYQELEKYKNNDHFFFDNTEALSAVCNAPKTKNGIYTVLELKDGRINLVYVGSSGKIQNNGKIKHRKGGLFDRIVNGKQFGKPRRTSWSDKLVKEKIDALDIYWYDTFSDGDIPATIEGKIIQRVFNDYGCLPRWNKEY